MKIQTRLLTLAAVLALAACDSGTGPDGTVPLSLSVAVTPTAPAATGAAASLPLAFAESYTDGVNSLVVTRVAIVVSEVELERMNYADCDVVEGDDDSCEEFETGPFLMELPLDGSVDQVLSAEVPPDVYDELEFEIDNPDDDDQAERDFVAANPDFDRVSIRVEGTWNGEDFVFLSRMEAEQEMDLIPPLEVAEGSGPLNLTLSLDISGWFVDGSGNLIDPRTANRDGVNEEMVEDNIERSIDLFEDDDRDGDDDSKDDD